MKKCFALCLTLFAVSALLLGMSVFASAYQGSTADAVENIDADSVCSLAVSFRQNNIIFSDEEIKIYRVASVDGNLNYTVTSDFSKCGIDFSKVKSSSEFPSMVLNINGHILNDGIQAYKSGITDETGKVMFDNLQTGIYLVSSVRRLIDETNYTFESFMISVPAVGTDGEWVYNVEANPKPTTGSHTNGLVEYSLIIMWEDSGSNKRPKSVDLVLYKNGKIYSNITLTADNNWTYKWMDVDDGSEWNIVQNPLSENYYNLSIVKKGDKFIIVNTVNEEKKEEPISPQTGIKSYIPLYSVVMLLSGFGMIITGVYGKRKEENR